MPVKRRGGVVGQPGNQAAVGNQGGRPTKYDPSMCGLVYRLALLGMTDEEMATALEVDISTLYRWKAQHPEFREAILDGGPKADAIVAERTFMRACGYSHKAEKIFLDHDAKGRAKIIRAEYVEHYPPDTRAATLWLTNRGKGKWRNRIEHDGEVGIPVKFIVERTERSPPMPDEEDA